VSAPPVVHIIPDTICVGNSIQLKTIENLSTFTSYEWSSTELKPTETTTYSINIVDTNGCAGSGSAQMIVIQKPDGSPYLDTIIIGEQIALPIDNQFGSLIFKWNPEKGLSCLDCSNPLIRPMGDTVYNLVMTDVRGCFSTDKKFTIIVKPNIHIKLPTTFTPNGDGVNEIIYVEQWGVKQLISFEIYNRWGEIIFKTENIEEGWDGTFKGELQNNDVYAYKVIATSWLNTEVSKEGYIHLMR
jgi:gliding motility-associated-like protein